MILSSSRNRMICWRTLSTSSECDIHFVPAEYYVNSTSNLLRVKGDAQPRFQFGQHRCRCAPYFGLSSAIEQEDPSATVLAHPFILPLCLFVEKKRQRHFDNFHNLHRIRCEGWAIGKIANEGMYLKIAGRHIDRCQRAKNL